MTDSNLTLGQPRQLGVQALRNVGWLLVRHLATVAWSAIATFYLARVLGISEFGLLLFAQTIVGYFVLLVDNALQLAGTREVAASHEPRLIVEFILLRIGFALLVAVTLGFGVWLWPTTESMRLVLTASILWLIPSALHTGWVFQGLQRTAIPALTEMVFALGYLGGLILFVHSERDILLAPILQFTAGSLSSGILLVSVWRSIRSSPVPDRTSFDRRIYFRGSGSIVAVTALGAAQLNSSIVLLGFLASPDAVAWFGAAHKVLYPFLSLASVIGAGILPMMVKVPHDESGSLTPFLSSLLKLTLSLATPLAIAGTLLAVPIMDALYGRDYLPGAGAFRVLVWIVVLVLAATPLSMLLVARQKYRELLGISAIATSSCVGLNLLLIPQDSTLGASIASLVSYAVVLSITYARCYRVTPIRLNAWWVLRFVISCVAMVVALVAAPNELWVLLLGAVVYGTVAILTRIWTLPHFAVVFHKAFSA
jgi:polysaccharide transporter, PST family